LDLNELSSCLLLELLVTHPRTGLLSLSSRQLYHSFHLLPLFHLVSLNRRLPLQRSYLLQLYLRLRLLSLLLPLLFLLRPHHPLCHYYPHRSLLLQRLPLDLNELSSCLLLDLLARHQLTGFLSLSSRLLYRSFHLLPLALLVVSLSRRFSISPPSTVRFYTTLFRSSSFTCVFGCFHCFFRCFFCCVHIIRFAITIRIVHCYFRGYHLI